MKSVAGAEGHPLSAQSQSHISWCQPSQLYTVHACATDPRLPHSMHCCVSRYAALLLTPQPRDPYTLFAHRRGLDHLHADRRCVAVS